MARLFAALLICALAGCAATPRAACVLPAQRPMILVQLFFGRDIAGRAPLSDAEWADFAADSIAGNFPDGFTVIDGDGQWQDRQTHRSVSERSKIVSIVADDTPALAGKLAVVMEAYRRRFHQQSVGLVTNAVCAAF